MRLHCLVPAEIDDPVQPSGGNRYDRHLIEGLRAQGHAVHEHRIGGLWPEPGAQGGEALVQGNEAPARGNEALARVLGSLPDGALVLCDGLALNVGGDTLAAHCARLRLVGLLHALPAGSALAPGSNGQALLRSMRALIVTSAWCKQWLCAGCGLATERVSVALPGVAPAALAPLRSDGTRLLCVARVSPLKGHDTLVQALCSLHDLAWHLNCVGPIDDACFLDALQATAHAAGVADRLAFAGPLPPSRMARAYQDADVLLLASRQESYGMVVSEALACGLPVIATAVGGIPEALGAPVAGALPGLLVAPDSPAALAFAVRRWLTDAPLRGRLRRVARVRRRALGPWSDTAGRVAAVLADV